MKLQILLVDDDEIFLMMSKRMIEISEFHLIPLSFLNGSSASDYLRKSYQQDVAYLVLLDINMPVMNGWEFLDAIKLFAKPSNTFVFMVTSSTDDADIAKAKLNPFVIEYLPKPVMVETLIQLKALPQLSPIFKPAE